MTADKDEKGEATSSATAPTAEVDEAAHEDEAAEKAAPANKSPVPAPDPGAPTADQQSAPLPESWPDRWWVWVLGGLAFAGFIGLLHVLT